MIAKPTCSGTTRQYYGTAALSILNRGSFLVFKCQEEYPALDPISMRERITISAHNKTQYSIATRAECIITPRLTSNAVRRL